MRAGAAPEMISLVKRSNCGDALDRSSPERLRDMHGGNGIQIEFIR